MILFKNMFSFISSFQMPIISISPLYIRFKCINLIWLLCCSPTNSACGNDSTDIKVSLITRLRKSSKQYYTLGQKKTAEKYTKMAHDPKNSNVLNKIHLNCHTSVC
jgi:hypothetical protein